MKKAIEAGGGRLEGKRAFKRAGVSARDPRARGSALDPRTKVSRWKTWGQARSFLEPDASTTAIGRDKFHARGFQS